MADPKEFGDSIEKARIYYGVLVPPTVGWEERGFELSQEDTIRAGMIQLAQAVLYHYDLLTVDEAKDIHARASFWATDRARPITKQEDPGTYDLLHEEGGWNLQ